MQSPLHAIFVLLLEVATWLGPLAGVWLALGERFREHAWCQAAAVLLNLVLIALVMVPSFRGQVSPSAAPQTEPTLPTSIDS